MLRENQTLVLMLDANRHVNIQSRNYQSVISNLIMR